MSKMAVPSPRPRRLATPSWFDLRLVLGVLLVLAAVAAGALLVSRASRTHPVLSASRALGAGTVLQASDLRTVQVQVPQAGAYVTNVDAVRGKQLTIGIAKGELVRVDALIPVPAHTTLTVPLAAGAAPPLRTGERIEVWLSTDSCPAVVLLPDVTVQSVRAGDESTFGAASGAQDVVINVDPELANRVVAALNIDQAHIRAGVLTGSPAPAPAPVSTPGPGPTRTASSAPTSSDAPPGLPADLAACATSSPPG
jgi:SAF domain